MSLEYYMCDFGCDFRVCGACFPRRKVHEILHDKAVAQSAAIGVAAKITECPEGHELF
jgi:hypothetical protein